MGPRHVAGALAKAHAARAFGADYVANILRQQQSPRRPQPPLRLRDPRLNELATDPLSLLDYDAFILESGKEPDDSARTETGSTEPGDDEPPDWRRRSLKLPPKTSASRPPWNGLPIWNWRPATAAPLNAASNARACRRSPASTPFTFSITSRRLQSKNRILRLLDLDVSAQGNQSCAHRESRRGQDLSFAKIIGWRSLPSESARSCSPPPWTC